jgi:very-short-patch-repair endonuclease
MSQFENKRIYLAGKVTPLNDWRETIISNQIYNEDNWGGYAIVFPDIPDIPLIFYTGPFLAYGKPHDYCASSHGLTNATSRSEIPEKCLRAIDHAHIVFAWLDDITAYGTLVELGYAKAKGKTIWLAGRREKLGDDEDNNPLWFAYQLADEVMLEEGESFTPSFALELLLRNPYQFDSPIEQSFWNTWERHHRQFDYNYKYCLRPQCQIGKYRVDFAHLETKTVIELDGFASHSSTEDIANDRKRQRFIEEQGWHVIRFGGKEIHHDVDACVLEVRRIIMRRLSSAI